MNITDVDDKILKRSQELKIPRETLTQKYEDDFFADMARLGNERPTIVPRATEYIKEMIDFIGELCKLDYAYAARDGSIYLDSKKAQSLVGYPSLLGSGRVLDGEPTNSAPGDKRNVADFALWKGAKTESPSDLWDAKPWGGLGRPGWHTECSAMIHATLGKVKGDGTIDIHGGGIDLCFPHHENERCQSQLHLKSDTPWAKIFCHTGHVTVDSIKMSKSLGNFSTLRGIMDSTELTSRQLRLLFVSAGRYASSLEWNQGSIERTKALDAQLEAALKPVKRACATRESLEKDDIAFISEVVQARETIQAALADDFDFPKVFEELQKLCRSINRRSTQPKQNSLDVQAQHLVSSTLEMLGFGGKSGVHPSYDDASIQATGSNKDAEVALDLLVKFRSKVRSAAKGGDLKAILQACDKARQNNPLIVIQDMKDGSSVWKRK
jgi:cysteinyl-tRNA synthetase